MARQATRQISPNDDELTIPITARTALEQADGDVVKATEIMLAKVMKDPTLYKPLMDPLVKNACYQAITSICNQTRRAIWHSKQPDNIEMKSRVVALARGTLSGLMEMQLPHGPKIGDAKRDDLAAAIETYRAEAGRHGNIARNMEWKARWLELMLQHLPTRKKVSQVMTDARLAELREEAIHE